MPRCTTTARPHGLSPESKHAALPINALCLATSCAAIQRSTDRRRADSVVLFGKLCCAACREAHRQGAVGTPHLRKEVRRDERRIRFSVRNHEHLRA
jgi:hypothetical protein